MSWFPASLREYERKNGEKRKKEKKKKKEIDLNKDMRVAE